MDTLEGGMLPIETQQVIDTVVEDKNMVVDSVVDSVVESVVDLVVDGSEDVTKKSIQVEDQDFNQKATMIFLFIFELYRAVMSSLLLMFVPQKCDDETCSPVSKFFSDSSHYETFVCSFNFITLFCLIVLYVFEVKREFILINYLDINKFKPRNNESVGNELENLSDDRKNRISNINDMHMYAGYGCIVMFSMNSCFSAVAVFNNYMGTETITVFLTNVLFMTGKLYDVYVVTNTKKYIFFSSYLSRKVQFNDVDKDKVLVRDD